CARDFAYFQPKVNLATPSPLQMQRRGVEDALDDVGVGDAGVARDLREQGGGGHAGQGVHLEEEDAALGGDASVYARVTGAAEQVVGGEGDAADLDVGGGRERRGHEVGRVVAQVLGLVVVEFLGRL